MICARFESRLLPSFSDYGLPSDHTTGTLQFDAAAQSTCTEYPLWKTHPILRTPIADFSRIN